MMTEREVTALMWKPWLLLKAATDLKTFAQEMFEGKPTSLTEYDLNIISYYLKLYGGR